MLLFLKKVGTWFSNNWKWILATLGTAGMILSLYFFKDDLKDQEIIKKKIDISKKKKEIIALQAQRDALAVDKTATREEIRETEERLKLIQADIDKRKAEIAKLTLQKKLEELDKLGY